MRAVLAMIAALTLARIAVLFLTPIGLYPDEAQYWLWSRTLDIGYFSKPPMVAWAIWLTSRAGDAEPWVRLSAPLFQAGATLTAFLIGRRLYGPAAGLAGAALYTLAPAVQLSSAVMATDAPLLMFLGLAILAYAAMLDTAEGRLGAVLAAALGASLGLAFLSKYAAIYLAIGLAVHAALSRQARAAWRPGAAAAAVAGLGIAVAPNLAWNASHGFATFHHTAANANWSQGALLHPAELLEFVASQFGAFGPIPFAVLIIGGVLLPLRRRLPPADLMLLCLAAPPLALVSLQALLSRANANWSAAAYLPAAVLVGAWLVRWRSRRLLAAAIGLQAVLAALFVLFVLSPATADSMGAANSFKRAKAWRETAQAVLDRAAVEAPAGLSAIAVNDRFLYYALAYYGRDYFRDPAAPPLRAWLLTGRPENQAEASAPLTSIEGGRVLCALYEGWRRPEMSADFGRVLGYQIVKVRLDRKRHRRIDLFVGEGFRPRPRDPITGLPIPS